MLSFLAKRVPRTRTASQTSIPFDDGRSSIQFLAPSDKYLVVNRWPPASSAQNRNVALRPPMHWHRRQDEHFHILSGKALFTLEGREIIKSAGESMVIPMKAFHTFCNASVTESLTIELALDPGSREKDEAFFSMSTPP